MIHMESSISTAIFVFHFYRPWLLYILAQCGVNGIMSVSVVWWM